MKFLSVVFFLAAVGAVLTVAAQAVPSDPAGHADRAAGEAVYKSTCAQCHDAGEHAPAVGVLRGLPADQIYEIITHGIMQPMAAGLTNTQRRDVAGYLGKATQTSSATRMCAAGSDWFDYASPILANGAGLSGVANTRALSPAAAGITQAMVPALHLRWSVPLINPTYPTVAGGALFIGTYDGKVIALDAATGCVHWIFDTGKTIRSGLVIAGWQGVARRSPTKAPLIYIGDKGGTVYALNAVTGTLVWHVRPHENPFAAILATPALYAGRLYVGFSSNEGDTGPAGDPKVSCCTFRGMVAALDAATGALIWRKYTLPEPAKPSRLNAIGVQQYGPAGAAVLGTPTVDVKRQRLYFASDNDYQDPRSDYSNTIFAVDLATGREIWHHKTTPGNPHNAACYVKGTNCPLVYNEANRTDWGFLAPIVVAKGADGRDILIAAQKSGQNWALDPDSGRVLWQTRVTNHKINYGAMHGIAVDGDALFIGSGEFLADPTKGAYPGYNELGLNRLDVSTGKVIWHTPVSANCPQATCRGYWNPPVVANGMVIDASVDQYLRIYDETSGKVLRRIDLDIDGGDRTKMNGGGPTLAGSMIYIGTDRTLQAYGVVQ